MPTPIESWSALREGNSRFVRDEATHLRQGSARRNETSGEQHPFAVVLGCSDSRVPAEIVFDQGIGDLFVVRNAGHVVDPHVVGSIEYGVDLMGANLVVVLGHRSCGAVAAATNTITTGEQTSASVRALVDAVIPSIVEFTAAGPESVAAMDPAQLLRAHVRRTVELVQASSPSIAEAVTDGRCAVVGAHYDLETGAVEVVTVAGDIGEAPTA